MARSADEHAWEPAPSGLLLPPGVYVDFEGERRGKTTQYLIEFRAYQTTGMLLPAGTVVVRLPDEELEDEPTS